MKISIIVLNDNVLEAIAIRAACESFNISVSLDYVGNVNDFIKLFETKDLNEIIVICCHGDKGKIYIPKLASHLEDEMPYKDFLTPANLNEFIITNKQTVILTGCMTGDQEFADAFLKSGASSFIAPTGYIEGSSATYFVISILYLFSYQKLNLREAFDRSAKDEDLRLFKIWSKESE